MQDMIEQFLLELEYTCFMEDLYENNMKCNYALVERVSVGGLPKPILSV